MENELDSIYELLSTNDNSSNNTSALKILLERIDGTLKSSDKNALESNIALLFGHDDEDIEGKNLVAFIKHFASSKSHYVVEFLKFMETLCQQYPEVLVNFVEKIIDISKQCVLSNSSYYGVAERGNILIRTAVETFHGYNFSGVYNLFKFQIKWNNLDTRPKVYLAFFKLVGVLCQRHPDSIQQEKCELLKEAAYVAAYYLAEGRQDKPGKFTMIEGSYEAVNGLLFLFSPDELKELSTELNKIYDSMKSVINDDSCHRHTAHRGA